MRERRKEDRLGGCFLRAIFIAAALFMATTSVYLIQCKVMPKERCTRLEAGNVVAKKYNRGSGLNLIVDTPDGRRRLGSAYLLQRRFAQINDGATVSGLIAHDDLLELWVNDQQVFSYEEYRSKELGFNRWFGSFSILLAALTGLFVLYPVWLKHESLIHDLRESIVLRNQNDKK